MEKSGMISHASKVASVLLAQPTLSLPPHLHPPPPTSTVIANNPKLLKSYSKLFLLYHPYATPQSIIQMEA